MIELLKSAIKNIERRYFERNERDFSYELYHQIRLLKLPDLMEVTCESSKNRFCNEDLLQYNQIVSKYFSTNTLNRNSIYRFPDLLIHQYETRDNQLLAVEIKNHGNALQIKKDLAKLIVYCRGRLKYERGVLIIIQPRQNIKVLVEVPDIREMLTEYPEVEIWTVCPERMEISNSNTI